MTFTPTTEDIQAEVENLAQLGISAYQTMHLVLCPLVTNEKEIGGKTIKMSDEYVKEQQKDLNLFFPVVSPAENTQRKNPVGLGDNVFSSGSKRFITIPRDQIAPVMKTAVYALVEDYDCHLVKRA